MKVHKPKIIGLTMLLVCTECGLDLPINYVCPLCEWKQTLSDDGTEILEICLPCVMH